MNKESKNKILLVLTGGTICSSKNENGLNALNTGAAVPTLVTMYEDLIPDEEKDIDFDTISPINTLSENMTVDKWNCLLGALKEIDFSQYMGVMILHGTDTLHLTAALMGVVLSDIGCPVMMLSAHRILDDPESNGPDNFVKSVRLIRKLSDDGRGGVFAVYRNVNGVSFVHHGTHLEECGDYSEDFYSSDMMEYDKLVSEWDVDWLDKAKNSESKLAAQADKNSADRDNSTELNIRIKTVGTLTDNVLYLRPYVGINYDRVNLDGVKAVLHGMYHSSTLNTEGGGPTSVMSLLRRCSEAGISFYIFPCKDGDYRYSTTKPLIDEGAKCIYGMTWEEAYVRLLIKYSEV